MKTKSKKQREKFNKEFLQALKEADEIAKKLNDLREGFSFYFAQKTF